MKHGQTRQSHSQGAVALLPLSKLPLCTDREQTPFREKPQVGVSTKTKISFRLTFLDWDGQWQQVRLIFSASKLGLISTIFTFRAEQPVVGLCHLSSLSLRVKEIM